MPTIIKACLQGAQIILIFFSIENMRSFESVITYYDQACKYTTEKHTIVMIGTKADIKDKRKVSYEEATQVAKSLGIHYVETSAKEDTGVRKAMNAAVLKYNKVATARKKQENTKSGETQPLVQGFFSRLLKWGSS